MNNIQKGRDGGSMSAKTRLAIPASSIWFGTHISWGEWLLGIYIIHGTVVMLLLGYRKRPSNCQSRR